MASMLSSSGSICSFSCYNPNTTTKCFFKPFSFSSPIPTITLSTRFSSHLSSLLRPKLHKFCIPSSEYEKSSGLPSESQPNIPLVENAMDLQIPRRSLLVKFTCNSCGEQTERLINRLAYERGTVFVQATVPPTQILQGRRKARRRGKVKISRRRLNLWLWTTMTNSVSPFLPSNQIRKCAGCLQHHKLVDNLELVVEYDFREDISTDPPADSK